MPAYLTTQLAPVGTTGNNTHGPKGGCDGARTICLEFKVEAVGATPTITYKLQGSVNVRPDDPNPPTAVWDDLALRVSNPSTAAITSDTKTATGTFYYFVDGLDIRRYRAVQLVTSANTNVTYSARIHIRED